MHSVNALLYSAGFAQNARHRVSEHHLAAPLCKFNEILHYWGVREETLTCCANRIHNKERIAMMATA